MKHKYIIASLVGIFLLVAGCANSSGTGNPQESSLKELCTNDGNMFMKMGPVLNGVPTGGAACSGCMIGNSHICDKEEYLKAAGR